MGTGATLAEDEGPRNDRYAGDQDLRTSRFASGPRPDGWARLAGTLDGNILAIGAGPVGRRHGSGDLVVIDLAEGGRLQIVARLAVGGRDRDPAARPARQAAVHAVAVGIVGDDENTLLGLCGRTENGARNDECGEDGAHSAIPQSVLPQGLPNKGRDAKSTMRGEILSRS